MAVQNELLNLLQAESEATVVYAAIVLSQVRKNTPKTLFNVKNSSWNLSDLNSFSRLSNLILGS